MHRLGVVLVAVGLWACPPQGPGQLDATAPGNSCASAIPFELPTDGGLVHLGGNAAGFGDHARCVTQKGEETGQGPDVVYRFETTAPVALDARIDGGTLHLGLETCSAVCDTGLLVLRARAPFDQQHLRVEVPAGQHTLWAEAAGPYELELSARPLSVGETCAEPLAVVAQPGVSTVELPLAEHFDEEFPASPLGCAMGTCSATTFVALSVTQPLGLRTHVTASEGLEVRARGACGGPVTLFDREPVVLAPGTHAIGIAALESPARQRSSYGATLTFDLQPLLPGDTCDTARPVVLAQGDGGMSASLSGETIAAFPTPGGTCGDPRSNDLYFALTLPGASDLRAEVTTTAATFRPALSLRAASCGGDDAVCDVAVVPGAAAVVLGTALPAGEYWLALRGAEGTAGPWQLNVTASPR